MVKAIQSITAISFPFAIFATGITLLPIIVSDGVMIVFDEISADIVFTQNRTHYYRGEEHNKKLEGEFYCVY